MNWFIVSTESVKKKEDLVWAFDSGCVHVEAYPSMLYAIRHEYGSKSICVCEACYNKTRDEEDAEEHTCADCGVPFQAKNGIAWEWYDFNPPQGDEPVWVCNSCRTKEKHLGRVRKDREDFKRELGSDNLLMMPTINLL